MCAYPLQGVRAKAKDGHNASALYALWVPMNSRTCAVLPYVLCFIFRSCSVVNFQYVLLCCEFCFCPNPLCISVTSFRIVYHLSVLICCVFRYPSVLCISILSFCVVYYLSVLSWCVFCYQGLYAVLCATTADYYLPTQACLQTELGQPACMTNTTQLCQTTNQAKQQYLHLSK